MIPTKNLRAGVTLLVIAGLAALLVLAPGPRDASLHGGAVRSVTPETTESVLDLQAPPVPAGTPDPNVPRTLEDLRALDARGSRCAEGQRRIFVRFHGDTIADVSHIDELVQRKGSVVVPLLPGRTTRGMPLSVLLDARHEAEAIEIWPCQGEPLRLEAEAIRAEPGRWVLARTPRVFLKLLDLREHARRPVLRNVAAVRLVP